MSINLRSFEKGDQAFIKAMLYQALFLRPGQEPFPVAILEEPTLRKYWVDFGEQRGDRALIAEVDAIPAGAIWIRQFSTQNPGYGFVANDIPELNMAIQPDYRGQGLGNQLLKAMLALVRSEGFRGLSLSVDKENWANQWYRKHGFKWHEDAGTAYILSTL
ncbi:MAG: GNAT family N-acetyltransferase [Bacteroidota bacterium]